MAIAGSDPALDILLLPLRSGALAWPADGALFLHARDGWALHRQPLPGLVCAAHFKPDADALQHAGFAMADAADRRWPLLMLLPPRQRDQARALLAHAVGRTAPGGRVLACLPNREGAPSVAADLARLAGPLQGLSGRHCRVFWSAPLQGAVDPALAAQWLAADAPRPIGAGRFLSRPGVFAWDRIDAGSALLAAHLPAALAGRGADLGCGYGYLAAEVLARCPVVSALDLYEADIRALELARINLQPCAGRVALAFHWHDVGSGLPQRYDFIVSNPPFHGPGRADRPDLGRRFIAAAAAALDPGGQLWLVANRHLPYEAQLQACFGSVRTLAQGDGFKVIAAFKPAPGRVR